MIVAAKIAIVLAIAITCAAVYWRRERDAVLYRPRRPDEDDVEQLVAMSYAIRLRRRSEAALICALALATVGGALYWIAPARTDLQVQERPAAGDIALPPPKPSPEPGREAEPVIASATTAQPNPVKVEGTVRAPRWWALAGLALLGAGAGFLVVGKGTVAKATGVTLASVGTLTATGTLLEFKVDSLLNIDKLPIEVSFPRTASVFAGGGLERLGELPGFGLGSAELKLEKVNAEAELDRIGETWAQRRASGRVGKLLLIGSTDRLALRRSLRSQYEANVGLARARAEAVKERLLEKTKHLPAGRQIEPHDVLVLVSGPGRTSGVALTSAERIGGVPDDRRVDVWAFWGWDEKTLPPVQR